MYLIEKKFLLHYSLYLISNIHPLKILFIIDLKKIYIYCFINKLETLPTTNKNFTNLTFSIIFIQKNNMNLKIHCDYQMKQ